MALCVFSLVCASHLDGGLEWAVIPDFGFLFSFLFFVLFFEIGFLCVALPVHNSLCRG